MKKFRFMPSEENFVEVFDEIAVVLVEAAAGLYDLVTDYRDVREKTQALRQMEKRVDKATNDICARINASFVTPIDREDIRELAARMDDVLDYIEAAADRMQLYEIESPREEAIEISALLVESTKHIRTGVRALSNYRKIESVLNPCIEINKLENRADAFVREGLRKLFKQESRPLEIAKWLEIYSRLETAADRCEDVANILESIVVKNA